jgi:hypothetical protein
VYIRTARHSRPALLLYRSTNLAPRSILVWLFLIASLPVSARPRSRPDLSPHFASAGDPDTSSGIEINPPNPLSDVAHQPWPQPSNSAIRSCIYTCASAAPPRYRALLPSVGHIQPTERPTPALCRLTNPQSVISSRSSLPRLAHLSPCDNRQSLSTCSTPPLLER